MRRLAGLSTSRGYTAVPLTPREREVLALLAEGHRPGEIAEELCITRKTTATHIEHILGKLGAHSQAQAVAIALREGLGMPQPLTPTAAS